MAHIKMPIMMTIRGARRPVNFQPIHSWVYEVNQKRSLDSDSDDSDDNAGSSDSSGTDGMEDIVYCDGTGTLDEEKRTMIFNWGKEIFGYPHFCEGKFKSPMVAYGAATELTLAFVER